MEPERMRNLFEESRVARLATVTPSLRAHVVPVTFTVIDDIAYTAIDYKPKTTTDLARIRNVAAHPEVSLLADHYDDDWSTLWWVRIDGEARVLRTGEEREAAVEQLAKKYDQYRDERPDGAVIAVDITRWSGWSSDSVDAADTAE